MKLNHDIYKASMENIRISDETGRKLLENAMQKNVQHKKKWRTQIAAAIAGILLVSLSVNGICYARTGKNVLEMFASLFENISSGSPSEELTAMADGAKELNQSVTHGNLRFTLERYIFDKQNGEVFIVMRTDSLNGTPLDVDSVNKYYHISILGEYGSMGKHSAPTFNETKTSMRMFYRNTDQFAESDTPPDKITVEIVHCIYGDSEDTAETETIGTFTLTEPTGQLKSRSVDCSSLRYCVSKARITGGGFSLAFDKDICNVLDTPDAPFHNIDITMADGTIYRIEVDKAYQWNYKVPVYDSEGKLKNEDDFTSKELDALKVARNQDDTESSADNIHPVGSYSFISNAENGRTYFYAAFDDFINVDDIASVYIDNVEMQLE